MKIDDVCYVQASKSRGSKQFGKGQSQLCEVAFNRASLLAISRSSPVFLT
jgi:hypothetical protein